MPRLISLAVLALALALPAAADAKRIGGMSICGSDGCTAVRGADAQHFHDSGGMNSYPMGRAPRPGPFYRVELRVLDHLGREAERFANFYIPSARALQRVEDVGGWMRLDDHAAGLLDAMIGEARPLPASRLPDLSEDVSADGSAGGPRRLPAYGPAASADDDGATLGWGVAGPAGLAIVLLAGLAVVAGRRRRAG